MKFVSSSHTAILGSVLLLVATAGAQETPPSPAVGSPAPAASAGEAAKLLTTEDVAAAQGCAITSAEGRVIATQPFRVSQCYFAATEPNKSVVLDVMQTNPADPEKRSIRKYWEGIFSRYDKPEDEEKEREEKERQAQEREKAGKPGGAPVAKMEEEDEEKEKLNNPPRRVTDLGDEAFWTRSHVNGTLFVVKGETMLRISAGGSEDDDKQLRKCRDLAEKALARL